MFKSRAPFYCAALTETQALALSQAFDNLAEVLQRRAVLS